MTLSSEIKTWCFVVAFLPVAAGMTGSDVAGAVRVCEQLEPASDARACAGGVGAAAAPDTGACQRFAASALRVACRSGVSA